MAKEIKMNTLQTLLIFLIIFIVAMLLCWLATGSPPFVRQRRRTEENTLPKKASSDVRVIKTKKAIIIEFLEKSEEVKQGCSSSRVPAENQKTKNDSCDSLSRASMFPKENETKAS